MILSSYLSKLPVFHGKYNYGVSKRKSQHRIKEYFSPVKEIKDDPGVWISNMPKKERALLAVVVDLESRYTINHARQDTMAAMAGCSRKHCNAILNKWDKQGVVRLANRGYISNRTKLSPWFKNCKHLLPKLGQLVYAFLSLALLVPVNIYEQVTRREKENIYIKYSYIDNNVKRSLSSSETNTNTHKRGIAKTDNFRTDLNSDILTYNIAKALGCDINIAKSLNDITKLAMIKNNSKLLEKES